MTTVARLFENNRAWAGKRKEADPAFFDRLCEIQRPEFLWIGCSDSRVPANEIVGLAPGEMFVHRNVANIVVPGDPNCMAVVQYAIETLHVHDIIITGHYRCGGVRAVLDGGAGKDSASHVERWLAPLHHIALGHAAELSGLDDDSRWSRLCELNVLEQVKRLLSTDVLVNAKLRGVPVAVHGWIYDLSDGLIRELP